MSDVLLQQLGIPAPDVNLSVGVGLRRCEFHDQLADLLFTPSEDGNVNLQGEGIPREKIFLVGNVMIGSLVRLLPQTLQYPKNGLSVRYATLWLPCIVRLMSTRATSWSTS